MRLSRRGKRRLIVLAIAALALGAAVVAFSAIKRAQLRRMVAESRTEGIEAYKRGELEVALDKLSYYFTHEKDDLEANLVFAEARSRLPLPGGRHLFDAVDLYDSNGLELLDRTNVNDPAQRKEILQRLLELYAQLGDRERVADTAEALLKIEPDMIIALAARAEVHFLSREFEQAGEIANRLIELEPDSLTWRRMVLEVRDRQGASISSQIEQCRIWSEQYSADARFRLLAAAMLVDAGRMDDARAELQSVGSLSANSREVLEQLVAILDVLGLNEEADAALDSAMDRFPREWWPREMAVRRAWHRDEPERALELIAEARATLVDQPPVMYRLEAVSHIAAGHRDRALAAIKPLTELSTADKSLDDYRRWAVAVQAVLSDERQDWRQATQALQVAMAAAPHDPVLHFLMGDVCQLAGEQTRAIMAYQQAHVSAPTWMAAGVAYSRSLLEAGRLDEAFNVARLTITRNGIDRLQPFLQYVRCVLALWEAGTPAELIAGAGMFAELGQALIEIQKQFPADAEIASLRARAHLASGDRAAAEAFMREVMSHKDVAPSVATELAEVARTNDLDLEQPLLEHARDVGGLTLPVAFAIAEMLLREGEPNQGLTIIDQAIAASRLEHSWSEAEVRCARAAYLLRINHEEAMASLSAIVREFEDSADVQRFVLSQQRAWTDERLIAAAMGNLHRLLGDESTQVRLAEANFLLRFGSHDRGMVAKASASAQAVLEQAPDSLAALSLAAEAALLGERPDLNRAVDYLEHAVSQYPGQPNLLVRLISTLQRQGRFDEARRHLHSLAMVLQRFPEYAVDELRLLQAQGDFESALVRASASVDASSPPSQQLLLASVQERAGRISDAEQVYQRLLESQRNDPLVLAQAAEFFASTGRYERGMELLRQVPGDPESAARSLMIGSFQQRHGRLAEAEKSLQEAVSRDPRNPAAYEAIARHYLIVDQADKAREQALAGLRLDASHAGLRTAFALSTLASRDASRSEAIKLLRELNQDNDALLAMLQLLELIPLVDGSPAPETEHLTAARQLTDAFGTFLPAWQMAVALHVEAGRMNDAVSLAREAVSRLPGQPAPAQWATQLLMQAGRWDEALAEAQEWRRRTLADPVAADAATARILLVRDRAQEAATIITPHAGRIVDDRQRNPDQVLTLVEALVRTGDVTAASQLMAPMLNEDSRWRVAWIHAAELMQDADAERVLNELAGQVNANSERLTLASAWLTLARRSGSESHLARAEELASELKDDPATSVGAHIMLGAIAEAHGDLASAESSYRAAIHLAPQNAVALNNLAYVLCGQNRFADALPLAEQALALHADQPDFLDTYAHVLSGLNRLEEAEAALRRALDARRDDAELLLSLADVLLRRGNRADALLMLSQVERRSASLGPATLRRASDLRRRLNESAEASAPGNSADAPAASGSALP